MGRRRSKKKVKQSCGCGDDEIRKTAFIMVVFGLVTICAFFFPIKAWIVLLGVLLIYCGYKLSNYGK